MNTKLYVNNLTAATTYHELMDLFSAHGNVAEVLLPVDRANGRSRGFGLVTMATPEGARAAMEAINGKELGARTLTVSEVGPPGERAVSSSPSRNPRRSARHLY